jgi:hypothetical protein
MDQSKYPELFPPRPNELHFSNRYTTPVKNHRDFTLGYPNPTTSADINRSGYQVLRGVSYANSWTNANSVISSVVPNVTGTGIDVDVIVGDEGCWFGHVEFANNTGNGPVDYKWANAGNLLSSTGTCDLLDLVLDSPYYIDPAWFNANPGTRLTTRWDGTVVPTDAAARAWWTTASSRSAQFASAGTVPVPTSYTRANCNGSATDLSAEGTHGTPCAGQTYGRTHGWAYNANKWFVDAYGDYGFGLNVDLYFDVMKIFHQTKPVNPTYGNKNPTITSNSWGFRATQGTSGHYYFRQGTTGAGGVAYSSKPAFMQYLGSTGDIGRFKGEMIDNNLTVAGDELIASGVIFVAAAGNSNQQQVSSDHPNFNNYWSSSSGTPLNSAIHDEFGSLCLNTTNRRGFPQHIGKYISSGTVVYPVINIGALDDNYHTSGKEQKVNYSDMGNEIDVFAPGDGTLTSNWGAGLLIPRHDQRGGSALTSYDGSFNGTSSACPTATGMIATALQYNRNWTWQDVRTWLRSLSEQSTSTFYQGPEPSTATDSVWSDLNSLMGASRRVLYNNISESTSPLVTTLAISSSTLIINQLVTPFTPVTATGGNGLLTWAVNTPFPTGLAFNTGNGTITGTPTAISSASSYTITVNDATTSSGHVFVLAVSSVQVVATLVIPTRNLTVLGAVTPFIPVTATGGSGPLVWSINTPLPAGLIFNTSNGQISGTPTVVVTPGLYVISVTDGYTVDSKTFTLGTVVTPIVTTLNINSINLLSGILATPFTPVTATGGNGTLTWAISGTLPSGLIFNTVNGQITGTPTGLYAASAYTITVSDQIGQSSSKVFTLAILPVPLSTTQEIVRQIVLTGEYQEFTPVTYNGGYGVITWSIIPTLPNGFTLNTSTGKISGASSALSLSSQYIVTASDQAGQTSSKSFVLRIKSSLHLIFADEQNKVYNSLFDLIGTTATGYGSSLLSRAVLPGDVVEPNNWNIMGRDVVRCIIHQYGPNYNTESPYDIDIGNMLSANTGTIVDDAGPNRMYTNIQLLTATSATAHPSQMVTELVNPENIGPSTWDNYWEANRWQVINDSNGHAASISFTWSHSMQLNYFFNLGGNLTPSIDISGSIPSEVAAWSSLVTGANAVVFGKTEYYLALNNLDKIYRKIISAPGSTPYSKAIIVKYQIAGPVVTFSVNFVAGFSKLKTRGSEVRGKWVGTKNKTNDTVVNLTVRTDVLTEYSSGEFGGIQAPTPQSQLVGGFLSAPAAPIAPFTFAAGDQSDIRTIVLRNNSDSTATISDITLIGPGNGYSTGVVSTSTMVIEPISSSSFTIQYSGDTPGYNRGYIYINSNINPVVLFTEINVGGVTPNSWTVTTTTNELLSQDFVIDHAGGNYRGFDVSITTGSGFVCTPYTSGEIYDRFKVEFNPIGKANGVYTTTATVVIHPLDLTLGDIVAQVPISVTRNINDAHLGDWISARGVVNDAIGMSYDYIGGIKYLTVGLTTDPNPNILSGEDFTLWNEVYRIRITGEAQTYRTTSDNIVKSQDFFNGTTLGHHFGVGSALNSICTIKDDGTGKLSIVINTVRQETGDLFADITLESTAHAFYYYDEVVKRTSQLESVSEYTNYFTGFAATGEVTTKLVKPNLI